MKGLKKLIMLMTNVYGGDHNGMMKNQAKWQNYYQRIDRHDRMIQRYKFLKEKFSKQKAIGPALLTDEEKTEYEYLEWYNRKLEHHPRELK